MTRSRARSPWTRPRPASYSPTAAHRSCTGSSRTIATPAARWWTWCRPTFPAPSPVLSLYRPTTPAIPHVSTPRSTGSPATPTAYSTSRRRASPLVFEFQDENGVSARKEFRFDATSYTLTATISARRGTSPLNPAIQWGPGLGDKGAASGGGSIFTGNAGVASTRADASRRKGGAADARQGRRRRRFSRGPSASSAWTITTSCRSPSAISTAPQNIESLTLPGPEQHTAAAARIHVEAGGAGAGHQVLRRPQAVRRAAAPRPRLRAGRSTSARSPGSWCRCSARSNGSTASPATTAGRSSCSPSSSTS